jgi:hypothetical protein
MGLKRVISIFSFILIFLALLIFVAIAGFFIYAPGYIESKVIPDLMKKAEISSYSLHVRNVGISGAEVADLRFGDGKFPGIEIDSIRIDYSPLGLFHRKIDRVVLNGISIFLEYRDKKFSIKGFDFKNSGDLGPLRNLSISRFTIRNSILLFNWEDKELNVPFEMDLMFTGRDLTPDRVLLRVYPRGQAIRIECNIDHDKEIAGLCFSSEDFLLDAFSDVIKDTTGLNAGGLIDFNISTDVSFNPFRLYHMDAAIQLNRCDMAYENLLSVNNYNDGDKGSPIIIHLKSEDLHLWGFDISRVLISTPVGTILTAAGGEIRIEEKGIGADLAVQTYLSGIKGGNSLKIIRSPLVGWKVSAGILKKGPWEIQADGIGHGAEKTRTCGFLINGAGISSGTPEIHLKAKAEDKYISVLYRLKIPSVSIDNKISILNMNSVSVDGRYKGLYREPKKGTASFYLKASDIGIEMNSGDVSARVPEADINGNLVSDAKGGLSITGDLAFSGAGISAGDQDITVKGVSGDIPFQWPFKSEGRPGNIDVGAIRFKDLDLGEVKALIKQEKDVLILNGTYTSGLFPDLIMELSGTAGFIGEDKKALVNISLPGYNFPPDTNLKIIAPGLKDTLFQGSVTLSANIYFSAAGPGGKADIGIREAQIKVAGKDLILDGLSGELNFTDIFSLKSAPKQSIKIDRISFRDLKADNFKADFQIESKNSIFIEQCRFNWCQGHVSIQPFRFSPGIDDYRFTLNCDRLNLAAIMEQFKLARATGSGTVNGTIPIILSKGQLIFEDAFLYSTPGDGGNIHVTGAEALTAGLPPDSDQYMQMAIAQEALKDFEYKWAKMGLTTEGSDMVMKLQFDGKPANPLPFVYKKDIGKFIKLETDAKGSVFKGISLDINFRLPLNEILRYKDLF